MTDTNIHSLHNRRPSTPLSRSILVEKQTNAPSQEDYSKEVSATYDLLEKVRQKIAEGDEEHFGDITIRDLIVKSLSEYTLLYAFRQKKRHEELKKNREMWNSLAKVLK